MLRKRPGFFEDCGRHGLFAACRKRFSSVTVAGQKVRYDDVQKLPSSHHSEFLNHAVDATNPDLVCWVFEAMLIHSDGNFAACWSQVAKRLEKAQAVGKPGGKFDERLKTIVAMLLRYPESGKSINPDSESCYINYLVGEAYRARATKAKGVDKAELKTNKALALKYLGKAREQAAESEPEEAERKPPTRAERRLGVQVAALAVALAASYEAAAYLRHKGTRTQSMRE